MSRTVIIAGASATGKSTSYCAYDDDILDIHIRGLNPEETFIFNVASKELPVMGFTKIYKEKQRILNTEKYAEIIQMITKMAKLEKEGGLSTKNIIIEDAQYLIAFDFFNRRAETGYDKFAKMGYSFIELLSYIRTQLSDNIHVYIIMHTDFNEKGIEVSLKTIGKMLDEKFTPQGLFTTVLVASKEYEKGKKTMRYWFRTRPHHEDDIAKSPLGMFMEGKIPNDLALVREGLLKL